ncbi:hypothetical protein LCGC14_0303640 [marine sediment metagenome]|uniref:Type II secretion system protein GspG C-terminal domain-containing protein n=1 Tax=marine sediment metagenome TaxID=412755 RepID=A0A0F9TUE6_9ZZZZ|nr:type II secretion system protein [Phycisphaerae bacterium]HDZ44296.1 type II secretion system protein [Phycisphaerae bacterium]
MTRKAFSLIELLIVVAIIGLLSSIVVPSTARYLAVARKAVCATNLRLLFNYIVTAQNERIARHETEGPQSYLLEKDFWPRNVIVEARNAAVFLCPDDDGPGVEHLPLNYKSGIHGGWIPFDASHYSCVSRTGVDSSGNKYTEYVIEENDGLPSKWNHSGCCGWGQWSTNDGIWRVTEPKDGIRTLVLTYYHCSLPNELDVNGKIYKNLSSKVGMKFYFPDVRTSYGYNVQLDEHAIVDRETIVLMDFKDIYVDSADPLIVDDLNDLDSARHTGKHNILYASGAVKAVGSTWVYPTIYPAPWTPEAD